MDRKVYTLTVNPALDYVVEAEGFKANAVNRCAGGVFRPGGKGINVSIALKRLGRDSTVLGFAGGFTGIYLTRELRHICVSADFVGTMSVTRINVKIADSSKPSNDTTELNIPGEEILPEEWERLFGELAGLESDSLIAMCGSLPKGAPPDFYKQAIEALPEDALAIVDTSGAALEQAVKAKPFLIKPNLAELCELYGEAISGVEDAERLARRAIAEGARNVLVSLGKDGALLVTESGKVYRQAAVEVAEVKYTVGAGDNLLAGFIDGYLRTGDFSAALKAGADRAAKYISGCLD
jgi:1-phosphofructokinase